MIYIFPNYGTNISHLLLNAGQAYMLGCRDLFIRHRRFSNQFRMFGWNCEQRKTVEVLRILLAKVSRLRPSD